MRLVQQEKTFDKSLSDFLFWPSVGVPQNVQRHKELIEMHLGIYTWESSAAIQRWSTSSSAGEQERLLSFGSLRPFSHLTLMMATRV